ncbi:MAG TPA: hypothetical protein VFH03_24135 [Actinoplanes sp.]|nr:hypothetical protein [Actinoplanes sp.]
MEAITVEDAYSRLTGRAGSPELPGRAGPPSLADAVAAVAAVRDDDPVRLLDALVLLRWVRERLAAAEPELIAAARRAGVSWQALAPALGVTSRQAAERRYLRLLPAAAGQAGTTRDARVRAERDRRAGHRAVARWANDNTAGLRRLAGQISALTDLGTDAAGDLDRLQEALAEPDAAALPGLLARTHRHLGDHPELADQVGSVTASADEVRRRIQVERADGSAG